MSEFIELLMMPVNLVLTSLIGCMVVYWAFVMLGALDLESFDIDFDLDADLDVGDLDVGHHGHSVGEAVNTSSVLVSSLRFFNVGEVPITMLLSLMLISMWTISMIASHFLGGLGQVVGLLMIIPNIALSMFLTKLITTPMRGLFRGDDAHAAKYLDLTGKRCVICSGSVSETFGQAEINTDGAPLRLNVVASPDESLAQGDEAVIVDYDKERLVYRVAKFNLEGLA